MAHTAGPLARLCEALTPAVFASLRRRGYAVVDGAVGARWKAALRRDIDRLNATDRLHLNATHLVTDNNQAGTPTTQLLEKSGIFEAELADPGTLVDCAALAAVERDSTLVDRLNELGMASCGGSDVGARHRLARQTVKVQYNAGGGGCFPYHFDTDPALDSRRLTAILYLNDDEWDPRDGGQLQLAPWPRRAIEIDPQGDRLAIFASADMAHRVLPSRVPRYCLTMWLWAAAAGDEAAAATNDRNSRQQASCSSRRGHFLPPRHRPPPPLPTPQSRWRGAELKEGSATDLAAFAERRLWQQQQQQRPRTGSGPCGRQSTVSSNPTPAVIIAALQRVLAPQYRRHTVRWALAQDWANSIQESHPMGPAAASALATHWKEVGIIERALTQALVNDATAVGDGPGAAHRAAALLESLRRPGGLEQVLGIAVAPEASAAATEPDLGELLDWFG